jgi:hypothetical protein
MIRSRNFLVILFAFLWICTLSSFMFSYIKREPCKETLKHKEPIIQEGDIIFQSSESAQCEAVKQATHSIYSHCGIIFKDQGKLYVYEAVQPVRKTLLADWIMHGTGARHLIKRYIRADTLLKSEVLAKMKKQAKGYLGKNYDLQFGWDDSRLYCSELVWKIYNESAALEICPLRSLKDFDLSSPLVKKIMKDRYGDKVPYNEPVVAPSDLVESPLFMKVINK